MAIPTSKEMQKPILECAAKYNQAIHKSDFYDYLFNYFQVTDEEKEEAYPSGNGLVFLNKVAWALSDLKKKSLLEGTERGYYCITEKGKSFLTTNKVMVNQQSLEEENSEEENSEEKLYDSFDKIQQKICDEIIEEILKKSPYDFEQIVLDLLKKMGYGGSVENSGEVTQRSNDGGIDVEIKEDILGLGRIHVQAKRYKPGNNVGRPDIQSFAGALLGKQSTKGIFITTSKYSKDALEYAQTLSPTRIVLIDGKQLAKHIYEYDLGMQTERAIQIKRLDSDYWDSFPNETSEN